MHKEKRRGTRIEGYAVTKVDQNYKYYRKSAIMRLFV
jgi:hypothetical protein